MADELEPQFAKDEDLERAKALWKENGRSITFGVLLGLSAIAGYNGWEWWQKKQGEEASTLYHNMLALDLAEESATGLVSDLQKDYGATPYASLAAFALAKHHVQQGELEAAKSELQWVLDNSKDEGTKHVARLRLGAVMLGLNDADGVIAVASGHLKSEFASRYLEILGDAQVIKGDLEAARQSYEDARQALDGGAIDNLIKLKLDNLGNF